MVGSSFYKGGNMLKKISIPLLILFLLTGCTSASQKVVLADTGDEIVFEASENASAGAKALEEPLDVQGDSIDGSLAGERDAQQLQLAVYVCGAVASPGVYELDEGSRIMDAVEAAGGFSGDADTTYVNLAAKLTDGMKLLIPTIEETANAGKDNSFLTYEAGTLAEASDTPAGNQGGLININTATKEELKTLSGIGDSTAEKIIRYREDNGGFSKIEDIMKVSGIKEKLFSKIRDNITV